MSPWYERVDYNNNSNKIQNKKDISDIKMWMGNNYQWKT